MVISLHRSLCFNAAVLLLMQFRFSTFGDEYMAMDDYRFAPEIVNSVSTWRGEWTREADEPVFTTNVLTYGQTVWFAYRAPSNGVVTLSVNAPQGHGTNWFYPVLAVFTGETLTTAERKPCAEIYPRSNGGFPFESMFADLHAMRWIFQVEAGQVYRIGMDRKMTYEFVEDPETGSTRHVPATNQTVWGGDVHASLEFTPAPPNDSFENAAVVPSAETTDFFGRIDGATREDGEALIEGGTGRTVWYRWKAPAKGMYTIVPYKLPDDPEMLPILTAWRGTALTNLIPYRTTSTRWEACYTQWRSKLGLAVNVEVGEELFLQVDSLHATHTGPFKFYIQREAAPLNDNFAAGKNVAGTAVVLDESTRGATLEAAEPAPDNADYGASVWYSWVAPKEGVLTVSTNHPVIHPAPAAYNLPSPFDDPIGVVVTMPPRLCPWQEIDPDIFTPRVSIYTGGALTSLVLHASGKLPITPVKAGETYSIQVESRRAVPGDFRLSFALNDLPVNDNFAQAFALGGGHVKFHSYFTGASSEANEPSHAGVPAERSLWWVWTAPATGNACLEADVTRVGTRFIVYSGTNFGSLSPLAHGTNTLDYSTQACFSAERGQRYYIAADLGGEGEETANLDVHLDLRMWVSEIYVDRPRLKSSGAFSFLHWERAGRTVRVEYSGDLNSWAPLSTNQLLSDVTRFIVPKGADGGAFFRVVRVQ